MEGDNLRAVGTEYNKGTCSNMSIEQDLDSMKESTTQSESVKGDIETIDDFDFDMTQRKMNLIVSSFDDVQVNLEDLVKEEEIIY